MIAEYLKQQSLVKSGAMANSTKPSGSYCRSTGVSQPCHQAITSASCVTNLVPKSNTARP